MSIDDLDFRWCNTMDWVTKEITVDASLDLSNHLGGLVLEEEQKLADPTGFEKSSILYQGFVVAKNVTSAFQLFCATFLITLQVIASSMCFTLLPEEKLRFSTTSKDFGCWKRLGSMSRLGVSSYFFPIFWSNSNGCLVRLSTASQQCVDSWLCSLSPFLLFPTTNPGDFASLLTAGFRDPDFPCRCWWPFSFVVMQFSCGTLLFSRMKFNRSAAFLIFNAHFEQTQR